LVGEPLYESFSILETGIVHCRTIQPERATCCRCKVHIAVIAQVSGGKLRQEDTHLETDAEPLSFPRTVQRSRLGFWPAECQENPSAESSDHHFEIGSRDRQKTVRTLAMAAPHFLHERMIGESVRKVEEVVLTLHGYIRIRL